MTGPHPWQRPEHAPPGAEAAEAGVCGDGHVELRNSCHPELFIAFNRAPWFEFVQAVKAGEYDTLLAGSLDLGIELAIPAAASDRTDRVVRRARQLMVLLGDETGPPLEPEDGRTLMLIRRKAGAPGFTLTVPRWLLR